MKTVIQKNTKLSKYLFSDAEKISINDKIITTEKFIVSDLNNSNAEIIEVDDAPSDWAADKYLYVNREWVKNDQWTPLVRETEEEIANRILQSIDPSQINA